MSWLSVVGIGEDGIDGLGCLSRSVIEQAEVLVGGSRHLAMLPLDQRERITWNPDIEITIGQILTYQPRSVCVLASGDPLWYGIGVRLADKVPNILVIPAPSSFSLACARLGWALAGVETLSLCGRPPELLCSYLYPKGKLLILSADGRTPHKIAQILMEIGFEDSIVMVFGHLGGEKETIVKFLAKNLEGDFPSLNLVAIECVSNNPHYSRVPGLPDRAYFHDGQLTKQEVRSVTLSALSPQPGELLWDVGAGCGSIGIEWMRVHPRCQAIAIEQSRSAYIAQNAFALGVPNLQIVMGHAPQALVGLPTPQAIFVGGGVTTPNLLETCWQSLPHLGRLVVNVVTIEGEAKLYEWQQKLGGSLTKISIERIEPIGNFRLWKPMNPIVQWAVTKKFA